MGIGTGIAVAGGIAAAGSIGGSLLSGNAAESAANTAADAQTQASNLQYQEWQQQQAQMQPWLQAGTAGVNSLAYGMGLSNTGGTPGQVQGGLTNIPKFSFDPTQINQNPDYQWTQNQAMNALGSKAAAAGNYGSGNMGVAMEGEAAGLASQYMNQYYNQALNTYGQNLNSQYTMPYNMLSGISGTGQNQSQAMGNMGMNAATQMGNYGVGAGNASAAGTMGAANAYSSGLNNLGANAMSGYANYLGYTQNQNILNQGNQAQDYNYGWGGTAQNF